MKRKILLSCIMFVATLSALVVLTLQWTGVRASSFNVAIIGGGINARQTSHITIATTLHARIGMRIFYRCSSPAEQVRTVYPNAGANSLGRYTWQWSKGVPCYTGSASVIVVSTFSGKQAVAQKIFTVVPLGRRESQSLVV
jgi:hypothetical protein